MILSVFAPLLLATLGLGAAVSPAAPDPQAIITLSNADIASFLPYTRFAAVAYCPPSVTLAWICGANCETNPSFIPIAAGGDGNKIQFWYVGFHLPSSEIIVSHQGTNFTKIDPVLRDINILFENLDKDVFPGVPEGIQIHSGFAKSQKKTADVILQAVQTGLIKFNAKKVTVTGHSLGAAVGLLDAMFLRLHVPADVMVRFIGYALPRVGNQAFADFVDDSGVQVVYINNKKDLVPILPGRFLGYRHPSGEIHIQNSGIWVSCPGQENPSTRCTTGDVPTVFRSNLNNHNGPYQGIEMGRC
ncbi:lipase [Trametes versicolor FP-101664 SS1]|uniref:lipase n=1 Tax=Trametes versicolor (strain FP-101664) TaxID=717944 RepID=UPI0004623CAC|nr:lipase [Trametes versicolor FP-101664 SS1]EIW57887.1 lipase [Trametes versicolor FP-101664 SS1]